ncbi:MAG: hypothetical protein AAF598_02850, partial [Bacteroidota bacterium]
KTVPPRWGLIFFFPYQGFTPLATAMPPRWGLNLISSLPGVYTPGYCGVAPIGLGEQYLK